AKGERGDDAEVAAASAPQRPEQIGVFSLACEEAFAVGTNHLDGEQVVAGEAELPRLEADAATERDSGDADRRAGSGRNAESIRPEFPVQVAESNTGADDGLTRRRIDADRVQGRDVDNQSVVNDRKRFVA